MEIDLNKIKSVGNNIDRGISFIVYGNPGAGKTTLLTTLPPEETLIINTEAGLGPLLGKGHFVFNLNEFVEDGEIERVVDELYMKLRTEPHPFKYIAIDNLTELENQLLLCLTRRRGKESPSIKEYGDVAFKMKEWVHLFRDLEHQGITVVLNAWEFPIELKNFNGEVLTQIFPKVSKSYAPNICGLVDVVGHMEVHEKSGKHWLRLRQNDQYLCKSQFKGVGGANDPSGEVADLMEVIRKIRSYEYGNATGDSPVSATAKPTKTAGGKESNTSKSTGSN